MIWVWNYYDWLYLDEFIFGGRYQVTGEVMVCPDPVNGNPLIHDLIIKEIWDVEEEKDLTNVFSYDTVWDELEAKLI